MIMTVNHVYGAPYFDHNMHRIIDKAAAHYSDWELIHFIMAEYRYARRTLTMSAVNRVQDRFGGHQQ